MQRLYRKRIVLGVGGGIAAYKSAELVRRLRDQGRRVGLFRPMTLWPFPSKRLADLSRRVKKFLVVEMSYGQMVEDVRLSSGSGAKVDFLGRSGGGIPSEEEIIKKVNQII